MSVLRLIIKSLLHFKEQHLAVFGGTMLATAVLTGALIIGDSVRYSLGKLVDFRLGNTQFSILSGSRFMRAQLAADIALDLNAPATPILLLQGIVIHPGTGKKINTVQVAGIDSGLSSFALSRFAVPGPEEAIISMNIAQRLGLKRGDLFLLRVEKAGLIPVNAPFSPENGSYVALWLKVRGIANDSTFGRFSLRNNQQAPYNIFVSREYLADNLRLESFANVILVANDKNNSMKAGDVRVALKKCWQLQDASLNINVLGETGQYDLTSSRVFLDDTVAGMVSELKLPHINILTYLVNSFHFRQKQTPYSFVTTASPPLVPENTEDDEIIINRWLADDLGAAKFDTLKLDYFIVGPLRSLQNGSSKFVIKRIISTDSSRSAKMLMPSFPGLSDAGSCRDWNTGIPVDLKHIRDKDEKYWKEYKGSPKAYFSLKAGQSIWNNRFGKYTAIRFNEKDIAVDSLKKLLLNKLSPSDIGIEVIQARLTGKEAAANSVDFGSLFLYLSFFVIAASLLLTILIYTLNTETRTQESAVLAGLGYKRNLIIGLRLAESVPTVITGGIAGAFAGIAYNYIMLSGLNSLWQEAVRTNLLKVQVSSATMFIGAITGIILAFVSIWWVSSRKLRNPVAGLFKDYLMVGVNTPSTRKRFSRIIAIIFIGCSIALVVYSLISSAFQDAGLFLAAGGLFLMGSILLFDYFVRRSMDNVRIRMSIIHLALKNAGRSRGRSLSVIIILAIGVFTIMLTGAYRRTFYGAESHVKSGTGGYQLWVQTSLPVPFNLNIADGRSRLIQENDKDLDSIFFIQFHSLEGDDASCLNLNQVQKPRILGIPERVFDRRQAFSFIRLAQGIDSNHPWKALEKDYGNNTYPAFADQTVIQYGLKKSLGDTLTYINEKGKPFRLILAGGLDNSVFQGSLLVADDVLLSQFPSSGGSRTMLVDAPPGKQGLVSGILSNSLQDYGIEITTASSRLGEFNSVENTYLTVFMALGGLGLLIGTFGLGLVLLRNMMERKPELALLTALGYRNKDLTLLVMAEYFFLLLTGLAIGIVSALIGIMPSFLSPLFTLQPGFLSVIILLILLSGVIWIYLPTRFFFRQSLLKSLRNE